MRALPDRVLVVTDRSRAGSELGQLVQRVGDAGSRWIWLRDRDLAPAERAALARELARIAQAVGATLTIGADAALAEAVGAGGVHLPAGEPVAPARARLGPDALIGVSAHSPAEVAAARDAGADYATLSPIFASRSKPGYGPPLGPEALTEAARTGLPVLALGGVTAESAHAGMAAGAAGVAVLGAVMTAADPAEAYRQLAHATASAHTSPPRRAPTR